VTASVFPLLSSVADVIPDRIDTGGLSAGSPAREGAHGETWTQTIYRAGDADITNLSGAGTPLLMPGVDVWERVDVTTGMMPIDIGAPGMAVTLTPRRPAASLMRAIELFGSPPFVNAGSATTVPPTLNRLKLARARQPADRRSADGWRQRPAVGQLDPIVLLRARQQRCPQRQPRLRFRQRDVRHPGPATSSG